MSTTSLNIKKFYIVEKGNFCFCMISNNSDFVLCSVSLLALTIERKYIYCVQETEPFEYNLDQHSSL